LGGESDSITGAKMKSTSGKENNGNGSNTSGFEGLPGGYRGGDADFFFIGIYGNWWSSSKYNTEDAWHRYLSYNFGFVRSDHREKHLGMYVRCIKD
jgi:uncharacterized protein (TIGR02145 family)